MYCLLACGAAGPRVAYSVYIVRKQGLKCLRAGLRTWKNAF